MGPPLEPSSEELAALAELGVFVRDGFLGREVARAAAEEAEALRPHLRPARVGRGASSPPSGRGDAILWLDRVPLGPALTTLRARLVALGAALRARAHLALGPAEIQLARYPGHGAGYPRHRDAFRDALPPRRRVTATVYLNRDWVPEAGGLLRLYLTDGPRDVEPRLDRLVVFLSERVEHEVLPSYAPRWAVTAWFAAP